MSESSSDASIISSYVKSGCQPPPPPPLGETIKNHVTGNSRAQRTDLQTSLFNLIQANVINVHSVPAKNGEKQKNMTR